MNRRHVIEDSFSEDDDDRIKFTKTEGEDSPNEDDLDKSIDIDALINEQPSTETSSRIKKVRLNILSDHVHHPIEFYGGSWVIFY